MILIDGTPASGLPANDRGLHYGDGLFETIALKDGRALLWQAHLQRLETGCRRLQIPFPGVDALCADAELLGARSAGRQVLKIIVTRGSGGRGYAPPPDPRPSRIAALHAWPEYPALAWREGIDAPICAVRLARQPLLAGLKHLNRLEQVLARQELAARGAAEGVMLDGSGLVIEGSMSNLFVLRGDVLLTARLDQCGVAGLMRAEIMARAAHWSLRVEEREFEPAELYAADEAFLCNSLIGVWPLRAVAGRQFRSIARATAIGAELVAAGLAAVP